MCRRAQSYHLPDIHLVCLPHPNLENCVVSIDVLVKHMVKLKSRTEKTYESVSCTYQTHYWRFSLVMTDIQVHHAVWFLCCEINRMQTLLITTSTWSIIKMLPTSQQLFLFVNSMCGSRAHCPSNLIYSRYQYFKVNRAKVASNYWKLRIHRWQEWTHTICTQM